MIAYYIVLGLFAGFLVWGAIEDIRFRAVSSWILVVAGLMSVALFILRWDSGWFWTVFLLALLSVVVMVLIWQKKAGWADYVLMMAIVLATETGVWLIALTVSLPVSLVWRLLDKRAKEAGLPFFAILSFSFILSFAGSVIWMWITNEG